MSVNTPVYWPGKSYQDSAGVSPIYDVVFPAAAATINQQIVAATAGLVIMVISGNLKSASAVNNAPIDFTSNAAGQLLRAYHIPNNAVATPNVNLEYNPVGIFRTLPGQGLFVNTYGPDAIIISLSYIIYVP